MRLIDGDALIAELNEIRYPGAPYVDAGIRIAVGKVCDAPTIEQRKTGKWIVYKAPDKYHCGLCKCPFCGEGMIAESDEYNFCPNCGARMDGDEE